MRNQKGKNNCPKCKRLKSEKSLLVIVYILLFYSFSWANDIPFKEVALRWYNIPYDPHIHNCLYKAQGYYNYLISQGIEAQLVVGRLRKEKFYRHAWVKYFDGKNWRIVDLTAEPKEWGYPENQYYWIKEEQIFANGKIP